MDELDRRIISELQGNSRQSNKRLSMTLGIEEATLRRRIDQLVSSGSLVFTALPDLKVLGYPIRAMFLIQAEHSKLDEIGKQLFSINCLRFIGYYFGNIDILAMGFFASIQELSDFTITTISKIDGISSVETLIEYELIKLVYDMDSFSRPAKMSTSKEINIKLSEFDRRLIIQLQKNARIPIKTLAQMFGTCDMTIHRHIQELLNSGAIEFTAISKCTEHLNRFELHIQTRPNRVLDVAESIAQYPHVFYVAIVSGPKQVLVGILAPSVDDLSTFMNQVLKKIEGIIAMETLTYIKIFKQTYSWLHE